MNNKKMGAKQGIRFLKMLIEQDIKKDYNFLEAIKEIKTDEDLKLYNLSWENARQNLCRNILNWINDFIDIED